MNFSTNNTNTSWGDGLVLGLRKGGRTRKRANRAKRELGYITGAAVRPRLDRSIPRDGQLRAHQLEVARTAHAASAGIKRGGRITEK
jgi:hypothetical protein